MPIVVHSWSKVIANPVVVPPIRCRFQLRFVLRELVELFFFAVKSIQSKQFSSPHPLLRVSSGRTGTLRTHMISINLTSLIYFPFISIFLAHFPRLFFRFGWDFPLSLGVCRKLLATWERCCSEKKTVEMRARLVVHLKSRLGGSDRPS